MDPDRAGFKLDDTGIHIHLPIETNGVPESGTKLSIDVTYFEAANLINKQTYPSGKFNLPLCNRLPKTTKCAADAQFNGG